MQWKIHNFHPELECSKISRMQNHNKSENLSQILSILYPFDVNPHFTFHFYFNSAAVFISHYSIQKQRSEKISKKNIAIHNIREIKRVGKKDWRWAGTKRSRCKLNFFCCFSFNKIKIAKCWRSVHTRENKYTSRRVARNDESNLL